MDTDIKKNIEWKCFAFGELSTRQLYEILALRIEVFVLEQNCPYQDADEKDFEALHFCGFNNNALVAYVRILKPGISYPEASIGRVVTKKEFRKQGLGVQLMKKAIDVTFQQFKSKRIRISAQLYLLDFYTNLGFQQTSETYLEDNIPHIEMILDN